MVTNIKQGFKEGMPRRTNSVGKVYTDPTEYTLAVERTHIQENAKHYDKYTKKKRGRPPKNQGQIKAIIKTGEYLIEFS